MTSKYLKQSTCSQLCFISVTLESSIESLPNSMNLVLLSFLSSLSASSRAILKTVISPCLAPVFISKFDESSSFQYFELNISEFRCSFERLDMMGNLILRCLLLHQNVFGWSPFRYLTFSCYLHDRFSIFLYNIILWDIIFLPKIYCFIKHPMISIALHLCIYLKIV